MVAGSSPVVLAELKSRKPQGLRLLPFLNRYSAYETWGQFEDKETVMLQRHFGVGLDLD